MKQSYNEGLFSFGFVSYSAGTPENGTDPEPLAFLLSGSHVVS